MNFKVFFGASGENFPSSMSSRYVKYVKYVKYVQSVIASPDFQPSQKRKSFSSAVE